jgi:hypothetical protein
VGIVKNLYVGGDGFFVDTTAGSAAGPEFNLYRNITGADANYLGQIKFKGKSDTGTERNYAKITGKISDASDTTEDGLIEFATIKDGSQSIRARLTSTNFQLLNDAGIESDGAVNITDATGSSSTATGALKVGGGAGIVQNLFVGGTGKIENVTDASSTTTGALQVLGGLGVAKTIHAADTTFESVKITDTRLTLQIKTPALS